MATINELAPGRTFCGIGTGNTAMRIMGHQFVMGRTIGDALKRAAGGEGAAYRYSFDMLGEAALTAAEYNNVAGASHMPLPTFAAASSVSSLIWSTAFLAPPYYGLQLLTG